MYKGYFNLFGTPAFIFLDYSKYYYSYSCWPFINILKYMENTLEQDLLNSQLKIIALFTEYQKLSQQIIKDRYNGAIYQLLESIASFDHQKIMQCQSFIEDKTALYHLDSIKAKIKNNSLNQTQQHAVDLQVDDPIQIQKKQLIEQKNANMNRQEDLTFTKLIQQVNQIYNQLIQKVKIDSQLSQKHDSKIMQKVIKEINGSAVIYSDLIEKLDVQEISQKATCLEAQNMNQQLLQKLKDSNMQNDENKVINSTINMKIQQISKENMYSISTNNQLKRQISMIEQKYKYKESQYLSQITKLNEINIDSINQINQNRNKIKELQQSKERIYQQLMNQKKKDKQVINNIISENSQQKIKILQQLKFIKQKERNYIQNFNIQQQNQHKIQQNQFLSVIFNKKVQDITPIIQQKLTHISIDDNKSIISQISEIFAVITNVNLDRLEQFNQNYSKLYKKYTQYQNILIYIASKSFIQTSCLNRCITKQKALLEVYRIGKQEAQQKCSKLQLQHDRLKKKLNQYKQQDHFNKTYLKKLKSSKIITHDDSLIISHQQKQQLTSQIDSLQKQIEAKNVNLMKNQVDLEDLLQKNQQHYKKLLQLEKKCHNHQKQIKIQRQSKERLERNIKLFELKLNNQKKIYEQGINQRQNKLKTQQANYERKLKLLKNELEQACQRQEQLKLQNEQLERNYQTRIRVIQQSHQKIQDQLRDIIRDNSDSDKELLTMISDLKQRIAQQREEKTRLNEVNATLTQRESVYNQKLNQMVEKHLKEISCYTQSEYSMNNTIASLLQKYNYNKLQQQQFKSQYESKLYLLHIALQESQQQSNELLHQISQYSKHIATLNIVIQEISINHAKEKEIGRKQLKQLIRQNEDLKSEVLQVKTQNQAKQRENRQYQVIIQKISQGMTRFQTDLQSVSTDKTDLQQKLMLKNRQIQTLNNWLNKKSQELIIKTQQLLEKDQQMLQHEQLSVIQKEQIDQLKNQIQNSKRQSLEKYQLIQLPTQNEQYIKEENNHSILSQQVRLQPKIKDEEDINQPSIQIEEGYF